MKTRVHFVVPSKRRAFRLLGLVVCLFSLALLTLPGLLAQTILSRIRGTVTDQTGAVVPGVDITLTALGTNLTRAVISDDLGNFEIPDVKHGIYRLEARMPGFNAHIDDNIIVETSQVRRINVQLEVGDTTTEVTVTSAAGVIEKEEAKISASFDKQYYQDTPMLGNDRFNPTMMLGTLPGVQNNEGGFNMNIAGLDGGNAVEEGMDGSATDGSINQINQMEDVVEVKIVTQNNSADHPRQAYFNLVTESGDNTFHGSVHYYQENSALNARQYFAPEKARALIHFFGVRAGGPIIKDKTFFFVSQNAQEDPSSTFFLASVPTDGMRVGDFTDVLNQRGTVIYDPQTGQPFPNNIIPPHRINPVSQKVLDTWLPAPNRGSPGLLVQNYGFLHPYPLDLYEVYYVNYRIDHQLSEDNNIFFRHSQRWTPYVLPRSYDGLSWTRARKAHHIVVSDTHVFSPTLVQTVQIGYYNNFIEDGTEKDGYQPPLGDEVVSFLGIQGVNPQNLSTMGFPDMNITGYRPVEVRPGGIVNSDNNFNVGSSTSWTVGNHSLKIGGEWRPHSNFREAAQRGTYGSFSFNGSITGTQSGCDPAQVTICGDAFADFLLGTPFTSRRVNDFTGRTQSAYELGLYFADAFKVSPNLTLDLGVRWDKLGAGNYEDGLHTNWDRETGNVIVSNLSAISPLYPTDIISVVEGRAQADTVGGFVPRIGAAYRIGNNTVIRGGYGIFNEYLGTYNNLPSDAAYELAETFQNQIVGGAPLFAFPNPFPGGTGIVGEQSISGFPQEMNPGYIQQFNFTLEHQIGDIGFRASYTGTRARGLDYSVQLNKPRPSLIPFTTARRPFPQFRNTNFRLRDGRVNYDAFTLRALKKVGGLNFDIWWTWAHNMDDRGNTENPYNLGLWNRNKLVPNQKAVINVQWNLPVGRGEKYLTDASSVVNGILGNWKMALVSFFQTGQWFSASFSGVDPSNTNTFGGLADRSCDGNFSSGQREINRWFDAGCFSVPAAGNFGNSGVNILEGPGRQVHNFLISKEFPIKERLRFQFSAAMTNVFNRGNFARPNGNISTATGDQVTRDVGIYNMEKGYARRVEMRLRIKW